MPSSKFNAQQKQRLKRRISQAIEDGHTLGAIARGLRVDRTTIWRWRSADEAFDAVCREGMFVADGLRLQMVEDRFYKDLIHGRVSGMERIFYLTNESNRKRGAPRRQNLMKIEAVIEGKEKIPLAVAQEAVARVEAARARNGKKTRR